MIPEDFAVPQQPVQTMQIGPNTPPGQPFTWNYSDIGRFRSADSFMIAKPAGYRAGIAPQLEFARDIVSRIDTSITDLGDPDEPPPTQHAITTARNILEHTAQLRKGFRFYASVICLDGAIRITWTSETRNVRLVCNPYPSPESYIYWELLIGKRSARHSSEKATAGALNKWLVWLNRSI